MTNITIYRDQNKNIVKFVMEGHSEAAEENDIVCAALSAVSHMVLSGLERVAQIQFGYEVEDGYLYAVLPKDLPADKRMQASALLDSMALFFENLKSQYCENVSIDNREV